ncbi:MAG: hypothetical protein ACAI44_03675 [Candidatus Sericytochromatia bacterium]
MSDKLKLRTGDSLLLLNAPTGFIPEFPYSNDPAARKAFDAVLLFVADQAELGRFAETAVSSLKPDGLLWVAYPKKTSKQSSDLNRDQGWDLLKAKGFEGVALVALDETWSALRLRHKAFVGSTRRRQ